MTKVILTDANFRQKHPDTIVLMCSDGRYTRAVHALLREHDRQNYDTTARPGGPALLDMSSATIVEVESARTEVSFLIAGHGIQQAILIAHDACGFYARRYAGQSADRIRARQSRDVVAAAAWLGRLHPQVMVHGYMATPDIKSCTVSFTPIDLSEASRMTVL